MTATVIYPNEANFEIELPAGKETAFMDRALHYIWQETQNGMADILGHESQTEKRNLRSSMVGDVFQIGGRYFIVDLVGYQEINSTILENYLPIPAADRLFGWEHVRRKYNLGIHIQTIH
jgi:hypothetical protein